MNDDDNDRADGPFQMFSRDKNREMAIKRG